jgi:hypothetical protein
MATQQQQALSVLASKFVADVMAVFGGDVTSPPPPTPPPPRAPSGGGGLCVPGGREKGVPLERASDEALSYWQKRIGEGLATCDPKYLAKDQALLSGLTAEIAARASGAGTPPAPAPPGAGTGNDDLPF